MGLVQRIAGGFGRFFRGIMNAGGVGGYEMLVDMTRRSDAGVPVNRESMLEYAPIYHSTCKIAGHFGLIPKRVQIRRGEEIIDVTRQRSALPDLLNRQPNEFMMSFDMFETVQKDAIIDGNGRIGIVRDGNGEPTTLIPIHPSSAWCFISWPEGGASTVSETNPFRALFGARAKWHHVTGASGETFILPDRDVIHIKGLQHDGIVGIPLWHLARNSVGSGLASEQYVNRTMKNNGVPGLILEAPAGVLPNDDKAREFLDTFRRMHEGSENASKTALLRYGVTANQLSQSGRDGQLVENRKFSRDEAFMWTGDMQWFDGGSAYSNAQDRDQAFKDYTLARWEGKYQGEMNAKLLTTQQIFRGWVIDLDMTAILRGSLKTRLEEYQIARQIGYWSQEEIRRRDGLPPPDPEENFQNPNTSSPSEAPAEETPAVAESPDMDDEDGEGNEQPQSRVIPQPKLEGPDRASRRAYTRLSGWFRQERSRLLDFAENPRDFVEKADDFYGKSRPKVAEMCLSIGCDCWVDESWQAVLSATECKPDELRDRIDSLTQDWPTKRASEIAGASNA